MAICVALSPIEAEAYVLVGEGRVAKADVLLVWHEGRQVVALLPHLHVVGDDALWVMPLPPGTEVMLAPDPDMFSAPEVEEDRGSAAERGEARDQELETPPAKNLGVLDSPRERARAALREGDRGQATPRGFLEHKGESGRMKDDRRSRDRRHGVRSLFPGDADAGSPKEDVEGLEKPVETSKAERELDGERRRLIAPRPLARPADRTRMLQALRRRGSAVVRPAEPPEIAFGQELYERLPAVLGENWRDHFPEGAVDSLVEEGWGLAWVRVPQRDGRFRFGPLAFSMESDKPTVSMRLVERTGRHVLALRFVSLESPVDLEEALYPYGLRNTQRPMPLDDALQAWLTAAGFSTSAEWRARGLSTGPLNTELHPIAGAADLVIPLAAAAVSEARAEVAPRERGRTGRGCGCSASRAVASDSDASRYLLGISLMALLLLVRRRSLARLVKRAGLACFFVVTAASVLALQQARAEEVASGEFRSPHMSPGNHARRILLYPEATEEGSAPPAVRVAARGLPLALYFPDNALDSRAEVHFIDAPERLGLRIAERTAFLYARPGAAPGHEALATITLSDGRPLTFVVRIVGQGGESDSTVDVFTTDRAVTSCGLELEKARDELAECRESTGDRALALVAGLLIEASSAERPVDHRTIRRRDKQGRIFVEVLDSLRLYQHTYVRLRLENRDGSGRAWTAGEPSLAIVGPGPRRRPLKVVSVFERPMVETGEAVMLVLGLFTPQLPTGATLRLALHEAEGQRHIVIDDLRI